MRNRAAMMAAAMLVALAGGGAVADQPLKVTTLLDATTTGDGQPLRYPEGAGKVTALLVEIAPGAETGLHRHPMPVIGYILEGEATVAAEGAAPRRFVAGDAFVETASWHNGRNSGTGPLRILAIYLGSDGQPLVVKPSGGSGGY